MASIDPKDGYYSVPVEEKAKRFLCFQWKGKVFMFKAIPFGFTSAPRSFTKLLKPIFSWFHEKGFSFIDDSFIVGRQQKSVKRQLVVKKVC